VVAFPLDLCRRHSFTLLHVFFSEGTPSTPNCLLSRVGRHDRDPVFAPRGIEQRVHFLFFVDLSLFPPLCRLRAFPLLSMSGSADVFFPFFRRGFLSFVTSGDRDLLALVPVVVRSALSGCGADDCFAFATISHALSAEILLRPGAPFPSLVASRFSALCVQTSTVSLLSFVTGVASQWDLSFMIICPLARDFLVPGRSASPSSGP